MALRFRLLIIAALVALTGCVQLTPDYLKVELTRDYFKGSAYTRADLLYKSGYLVEARQLAETISKDDPDYKAAQKLKTDISSVLEDISIRHTELGEDYENAEIYPAALREYGEALKLNPSNHTAKARIKELRAYLDEGKRPAPPAQPAAATAKKSDRGDDNDDPSFIANMHFNKGRIYLSSGTYNKAIDEFNLVLKYVPGHADAKRLLERAKAERDNSISAHLKKGIGYFEAEQMELAIKEWDFVLELDPDNKTAADYRSRADAIIKQLKKIREKQSGPSAGPLRS